MHNIYIIDEYYVHVLTFYAYIYTLLHIYL